MLMIISTLMLLLITIKSINSWNKQNCYSFNNGLDIYVNNTNANILNYYQCPDYDSIDNTACSYPMKTTNYSGNNIINITYSDIVFVMLIGGSRGGDRELVRHYWMDMIPKDISLDIVLIADSCVRGDDYLNHTCPDNDPAILFKNDLYEKHIDNNHTISVIRTQGTSDFGYFRLACKTLTGFQILYNMYPHKKYYMKVDDDTILFPKRLLHFLSTLHTVTVPETPLYFGNVLNDHKIFLLCNDFSFNETSNSVVHRSPVGSEANVTGLCYAQGGIYGFNSMALQSFLNTTLCVPDMDCEVVGEDAYVAYKIYRETRAFVIQCEGFQTQPEKNIHYRLHSAIAIHHISDHFLATHMSILNELKELETNGSSNHTFSHGNYTFSHGNHTFSHGNHTFSQGNYTVYMKL